MNSSTFPLPLPSGLIGFVCLAALLCCWPQSVAAQESVQQQRVLEVQMRQVELGQARAELERIQMLFGEGLTSAAVRDQTASVARLAELRYQMTVLSLLNLQPRLTVERAVKTRGPGGAQIVELTVSNQSAVFDEDQLKLLNNSSLGVSIPEELRARDLLDVFISLRETGEAGVKGESGKQGITIALPYELHLPRLRHGTSTTLRFHLLRDVNSVKVVSSDQAGQMELDLLLEQGETQQVVSVGAEQVSQEANMGGQANFDLIVSRPGLNSQSFRLDVAGLPKSIGAEWVDPASSARLSHLNFPLGSTEQALQLRLFVPERTNGDLVIDQPIDFFAIIGRKEVLGPRGEGQGKLNEAQLRESRVGWVQLQLTPRGIGRISVSADSLFATLQPGSGVETRLTVRNTGTRRLDNVEFQIDLPPGWISEIQPPLLEELDVNASREAKLIIRAPSEVSQGDFEARIKTISSAFNRPVPSEDKIFRIRVENRQNLWLTILLLAGLVALVVTILVVGIRMVKR